ncbi:TetR/AcrR family transcriptional regulator [Nesterenkonia haasae]|uniref:TetR/AcrR family transcriptional regulator n=1 Tax=Nesterenkonia haasae TaxID=2587813 RepID=UPI00139144E8|nr:TetR/AcrR family transcriptional regulator [Nesterenkonia haasae]NDK32676.1 TetR/AcrR family transcriptional regulator [Nesterenkonia haasae]
MREQNPLTTSLQLLWNGLPDPEKGPKPKLTLNQIVSAGVSLADAEGLDALSMRRLARALNVGTMSLYRYVPSKTELLNLMLDSVVGPSQQRLSSVDGGWRSFLTATVHAGRRLYLDHPWTLQANWSRPVLGPNSVADLELFMTGVRELPLSDQRKMDLATVLDSYAQGTARQEMMWINAAADSGMTDDEFWSYQLPTLEKEMTSGRFPMMAALDEETFNSTWDESFEFGLQLLLDGLENDIRRSERDSAPKKSKN